MLWTVRMSHLPILTSDTIEAFTLAGLLPLLSHWIFACLVPKLQNCRQ